MSEKISATIEDYLVTIFVLERDGESVNGVRLAELLGVTPPTVTNTLKRMVRDGLVTMDTAHLAASDQTGLRSGQLGDAQTYAGRVDAEPDARLVQTAQRSARIGTRHLQRSGSRAARRSRSSPKSARTATRFRGMRMRFQVGFPLTQASSGERGVIRRIHEFAENNSRSLASWKKIESRPGR